MKKMVVWFRLDLRLEDNPALKKAAEEGEVIPIFIWSEKEEGNWPFGEAQKAWLFHSLKALHASLRLKKSHLIIRKGDSLKELLSLLHETKADALFFNRRYEKYARERDQKVMDALLAKTFRVETFNASLLVEPWEILTKLQKPYQTFAPFWKTALKHGPFLPLKTPSFKSPASFPRSLKPEDLNLSKIPLMTWESGEEAAKRKLDRFCQKKVATYKELRDRPDLDSTSLLSPHLHFGEVGPRQIWAKAKQEPDFIRQLFWREFAYHLIYHFPDMAESSFQKLFSHFAWKVNDSALRSWKAGLTGYPIIDAGMPQLMETGWMHNRVRMLTASFLTKDLFMPWQEGAHWFWKTLVDADLANNTLGWQWTAGSGADYSPFWRIFNPTVQAKKFDPEGTYVKRFVPELKGLPKEWIHNPFLAPSNVLAKANISLGKTYPKPIVDHEKARKKALDYYRRLKK